MICYRDRWYCPYYNTCLKGEKCNRALTTEIEVLAKRAELLISQVVDKPDCYIEITEIFK